MSFSQQNQSHKKISTPALLFCRSSSRSPTYLQSRRSDSKNVNLTATNQSCQNHPLKQSHYLSQNNQQNFYYCERCAILLASQGFNVKKINVQQSRILSKINRQNRQQQIEQFLQKIKLANSNLESKKQQIKENLIVSQQFYGNQIQEINEYFNIIIQSLQLQKNKCYNYILNQRLHIQQPIRKISQQINGLKQQLQQIIQDIQENIQAVYQIQQSSYRPVIVEYQEKLRQFQNKFLQISIRPIQMKKIQFVGVPESIYSLSQILLKNSTERLSLGTDERKAEGHSLVFSFEGQQLKTGKSQQTLKNYLKIWEQ